MIERVTSSTKYLYHYTEANTAIDCILKSRTLKFGKYTGTNDPKESKFWSFDLGTNCNRDLGAYNMSELSKWLSMKLKEKTKLACFSMDTEGLSGNHMLDIFKRGFCKPRMWAQYADKHSGVCLVFDREKLIKRIENELSDDNLILSGEVIYRNRDIIPNIYNHDGQQYTINIDHLEMVGREEYVYAHLRTHYRRLFFEKMEDWRDEAEWRFVVFSQAEKDIYLNIEGSLVGIIFGDSAKEETIHDTMGLTEGWGLRYMGLKWKNCSPWYDYGNLRYAKKISHIDSCP